MHTLWFVALALQVAISLQSPISDRTMKQIMEMLGEHEDHHEEISDRLDQIGLWQYLHHGQHQMEEYKEKASGSEGENLIWRAAIKQFLSGEGDNSFLKSILMHAAAGESKPANEEQHIMAALFNHMIANPDDGNNELASKVIMHVAAKQSSEYRGVLRVLMMHKMSQHHGDEVELLKKLLTFLMSEEGGASEMKSKEMLLLLLQHYMSKDSGSRQKNQMGLILLHTLSEKDDPQSNELLRMLVLHMITESRKSSEELDTPEEKRWTYYPPGPCKVENNDGGVLMEYACPHDMQCSVGPVSYRGDSFLRRFYMCSYPSRFIIYHSCEVRNPSGDLMYRQPCVNASDSCDFGPFNVAYNGSTATVNYCSSYAREENYNIDEEAWKKIQEDFETNIWLRACAIVDRQYYPVLQRRCPYHQRCGSGPMEFSTSYYTPGTEIKFNAYVCDDDYDEEDGDQGNFLSEILETLLGFGAHGDLGANGDVGSMMGNMTGNADGAFMQFMIQQLMNHAKDKDEDRKPKEKMDDDSISLWLLHHFVSTVPEGDQWYGLLQSVLKHLKYKKEHMGLEQHDREVIHSIIAGFMEEMHGGEDDHRGGDRRDDRRDDRDSGDAESWMKLLRMLRQDGSAADMLEEHKEHHEEIDDHLKGLYAMMLSHAAEHKEGQEEEEHDGGDMKTMQALLKFVLEMMKNRRD